MAAAAKKKAFVLFPTLAIVSVDKKVPERCKYAISNRSGFKSEKKKEDDLQPTKKWHMKSSAPKGKQGTLLKSYRWKTISKWYIWKIPRTQSFNI